ncbi:MAG: MCP four helix bundle domain-containing protein, partial [Gemmatimonadetes bacterium]|nr:MCP four helix bundle domain-containing protein [Gemmatimonadota bacterium]
MHWTVSRRIAAGFALGLGLVVVVAVVGVIALSGSSKAYRAAVDYQRSVLLPGVRAESDFRRATRDLLEYLVLSQDDDLRSMDSVLGATRGYLAQARSAARDDAGRADWAQAEGDLAAWERVAREAVGAARANRRAEAIRIRDTRAAAARATTRQTMERGVARAQDATDTAVNAAARTTEWMRAVLLLGGLFALAAGAVSAVFLNRAVSGPLRESTGVLASSAAEILAATTQQASGASESAAAVTETVTTVDEVAQTAEQAAQRANSVAESAQRAAEIGMAGRKAVEDSTAATAAVKEQVESISESNLALAEQAPAIGEIIATVNDIAEQT